MKLRAINRDSLRADDAAGALYLAHLRMRMTPSWTTEILSSPAES